MADAEVAAAVEECAASLAAARCAVVPREAPYDVALVRKIWGALSSAGAARAAEIHPDRWRDEASPAFKAAAERGLRLGAVDHVRALDGLAEIRGRMVDAWGDVDLFLCPSAASSAWSLEDGFPASVAGRPGLPAVQNAFATWVNAIGHPGLSAPVRPHADGRPLGAVGRSPRRRGDGP